MRIGFAKRDVSPPVLAAGDLSIPMLGWRWERSKAYREIHDPLHARAMAVESGGATAVIFACDLFGDAVGFGNRCAAGLQARRGVPAAHVFFSCSHTHLGYICSLEAFRIGGYEIGPGTWSWLAAGAGEAIAQCAIAAAR
ncbi:MAG: hypothetical protein A3K19_16670 [Lentisphaerae bacterium RIFOXYB12_FULL_65_16]|nr:MAG: hypothetical protein A3K18_20430 [Lentisphaerae bacterium RIFOXYA12_64_32]OGV89075.1 MAG: hypothetical protein A3K19_16670 [Lentisphaerae bacterium RIFOXYB12_FULL_65_16]